MWDLFCSAFTTDCKLPLLPCELNTAEVSVPKGAGWVGFVVWGGFCFVFFVFLGGENPNNNNRQKRTGDSLCQSSLLCFPMASWNLGKAQVAKRHLIPSWDPVDNFYVTSLWKRKGRTPPGILPVLPQAQLFTQQNNSISHSLNLSHWQTSYWKESISRFTNKQSKDKTNHYSFSASSPTLKTAVRALLLQGIFNGIPTYFPGLTLGACFWPFPSVPLHRPQLSVGHSSRETLLTALLAKSFCALW